MQPTACGSALIQALDHPAVRAIAPRRQGRTERFPAPSQQQALGKCPVTSSFTFCQLAILERTRLPFNFLRLAAEYMLANAFSQVKNLPER